MRAINLLFVFIAVAFLSCSSDKKTISFYHWKSNAVMTGQIEDALEDSRAERIYLHYFDVDLRKENQHSDRAFPVYVLQKVDAAYQAFDIIPTVFISNQVLKESRDIALIAQQVHELIDEISLHHFGQKHTEIQIDCDWTKSTRALYFEFLTALKAHYTISVTIRLHQIKYPKETGVPPVSKGTLMLYNMGDFKDFQQNSIISSKITADYIHRNTSYPLELDIALPLFSQTVLKNLKDDYRLLNTCERVLLEQDTVHFKKESQNVFTVVSDTLYKGFYVSPGYQLKLEEHAQQQLIESYQICKASKLNIKEIIFYHLDDDILKGVDVNELIEQL